MTDYILAAAVLVLVLTVVACSVVWRRASRTADALLDPWTDPTLPPRCAETHPRWGTQCVRERHEDRGHADTYGGEWYTRGAS